MTQSPTLSQLAPQDVRETLARHILADGLDLVLDLERSHGVWLHDSEHDRDMLDLFGCFSTVALGYNHPKLNNPEFHREVLPAAVNKPSNSDLYTREMSEFVAAFSRTVPEPLRHHMFFIEGGALAVENALKAAFDWKVRKNLAAGRSRPAPGNTAPRSAAERQTGRGELGSQVLHFRQAFHGRSGYTLSLTNTADPAKYQYFPKFDWPRIDVPQVRFPMTAEVVAEIEAQEERALEQIRQALIERRHDIAALIVEPIQAEGGDNHLRPEFLHALRTLADEEEFLLIFDEVQTGFGTTGKWWSFEHFDVLPDIFAFGKKTQVCGICASRRLDEVDSVFSVSSRINSTWGGNLVDMVRCRRIVEIVEEDGLLDNATRVGALLLAGVERLAETFSQAVTNARGRGMFVAFDLADGATRDAALRAMAEEEVLALPCGERSVRFRPSLILTAGEAAEGLRRVEAALRKLL